MGRLGMLRRSKQYVQARHAKEDEQNVHYSVGRLGILRRMSRMGRLGMLRRMSSMGRLGMLRSPGTGLAC